MYVLHCSLFRACFMNLKSGALSKQAIAICVGAALKFRGSYVFPNYYVGDTYQEELTFFKNWISERLTWMDNNILTPAENNVDWSEFRVYPNPTVRMLNIIFYSDLNIDFKVTLIDVLGEHFMLDSQFSFSGIYTKEIDLNGFAKGIYLLSLESNDGIININKKLILQ